MNHLMLYIRNIWFYVITYFNDYSCFFCDMQLKTHTGLYYRSKTNGISMLKQALVTRRVFDLSYISLQCSGPAWECKNVWVWWRMHFKLMINIHHTQSLSCLHLSHSSLCDDEWWLIHPVTIVTPQPPILRRELRYRDGIEQTHCCHLGIMFSTKL